MPPKPQSLLDQEAYIGSLRPEDHKRRSLLESVEEAAADWVGMAVEDKRPVSGHKYGRRSLLQAAGPQAAFSPAGAPDAGAPAAAPAAVPAHKDGLSRWAIAGIVIGKVLFYSKCLTFCRMADECSIPLRRIAAAASCFVPPTAWLVRAVQMDVESLQDAFCMV